MTLIAEKIHCVRNERTVFQHISFTLLSGEILQIVGCNGAGKTSLLRIIAGLLKPHAGEIYWNNQLIHDEVSDYYDQLFYLGHTLAIKSELTVKENITYFPKNNHCADDEIKNILQAWSLDKYQNHLSDTLSQGQRQRLALARLQLSRSKIWILDEPFSNLDINGISQLDELLRTHAEKGGVILLSTHRHNTNHKTLRLEEFVNA